MQTDCVVDASACAAIAFGEPEGAQVVQALQSRRLIAPFLLDMEMANIYLTKCRRHPAQTADFVTGLHWYRQLSIHLIHVDIALLTPLAEQYRLTAYDAAYLALSLETGADLITLDKQLARAWLIATSNH